MKKINDILKIFVLIVAFGLFGVNEAALGAYNRTWTAGVAVNGGGTAKVEIFWKVAVEGTDKETTSSSSAVETISSSQTATFKTSLVKHGCKYSIESISDGYSFGGWYTTSGCTGSAASTSQSWTAQSATTDSWNITRYAYFAPVTVSSAGSSTISFNCPATKTTTLTFPVSSNADAAADFNVPTVTANSGWSMTEWSFNNSTKKVTVTLSFTANSNTSKGNHQATVTLKAKSNEQNTGTVTASVDLTPTLTFDNGTCDISVSDNDKTTLNVATLLTAYKGADNVAGDGAITYSLKTANSNVSLTSAGVFYAKATGTYTIVASAAKNRYYAKTAEFTVTVGKRTPTFVWQTPEHIYSGAVLENLAQAQYNGNNVAGLSYTYSSNNTTVAVVDGTTINVPTTGFNSAQTARISVTTAATDCYLEGSSYYDYWIEPKKTPEFYLNGTLLDKNVTTNLYLEIDSTAHFTFDKITAGFQYPTNPSHFTYNHASGILTATVAGDETFHFNEQGDAITFQHRCDLHLYVSKHPTELTTALVDNDVWMVDDSIAENTLYTLVKGDNSVPVDVSSDKPSVIAKENGKWVAKGAGSAKLTISQAATDKWSGASITRTIIVNRYTPVFDWSNLPDTLNFNSTFVNPVRSTSDGAITYKSNKSAVTVTNDSTTLHTAETADNAVTITAIQKPTYKYEGKTETKTVKVLKLRNHVQVEVKSNETYLAVRNKTEGDVAYTSDGIRLGGSKTGIRDDPAWDWYDKYVDIKFEGIPGTISFTTGNTSVAPTAKVTTILGKGAGNNNGFWYMIEYPEGESANTLWTENDNANPGNISYDLKPNTNKVRICYTGNFAGYVKNLTITERTELSIDGNVESLDFGSADAGSNATARNFTLDWYNLNPLTLSIEGGDGKYSVSPSSIASSKDSYGENVPVTVSYIHTAGGTHNATLVISEGTTVLKQISLTGTTNKVTPAITWKENLTPMSRGENVTDPAEAIVALTYTSSDSTVVDVDGNVLKPLKKGNATITASYDGTTDSVYNSNSSTINVLVTNLAVQHINWTQTFTRLKWTDDAVLSDKNTPDFDLEATVSYYDPESEQEVVITDRAVTYTSGNEAVVQVLPGNKLHVVGQGPTTLTAHIDGIVDSLYEATVIRNVIVREPTLDCDTWVLEDQSASMATEINSFSGVETVYNLTGEPGYLTVSAWREAIHILTDWTGGNLFVAEWYNNNWHELTGAEGLDLDLNTPKDFGPIALSREATKVKIFKKTGSTGIHAFSGAYVTLARYLELENTKNKKTHAINLTTDEAKPGVIVEKTFTVNYSYITDQLDVELKHGDKFSIVSATTIGNECGDKGTATVRVRFLSNDVDLYRDTLLVHNLTDTAYVYLSADVDKHHQQITWNPATQDLKTTDNVTFNATTSAAAAGLTVSYAVTAGSDVATVNVATGELTIIKSGDVTVEATCAGNNKYYDADTIAYAFHISKVTPEITTAPTATGVTLPATLVESNLSAGVASVAGTFAWTNPSTALVAGDVAYEVTFTPTNTNWYDTTTCMVAPHVSKATQTITWNFDVTEMYGNAAYTFDATASSGLTVTYSSSNNEVASVNGQKQLVLHKGGEVTITATQAGDDTYLPASEARTFTILRWTPTITAVPVGGSMYVGHVISDASLTDGHAFVGQQEIQGSFEWENANSATIDVPGQATHNVIFVPQNSNFYNNVVCENVSLTVLKYTPVITDNALSASSIEFPAQLSQSELSGSVTVMDLVKNPNEVVAGTVAWKEPTKVLRPGVHTATALFTPTNTSWYDAVEIPVLIEVTGGFIFDGDNTTWTEVDNWNGDLLPQANDPVLINSDVEITTTITVGSLTIKENVNVIVKEGAVLTIGNDNSETRAAYGNLRIEAGGEVILGDGELDVNDFTIEASIGDKTYAAKSGQLRRSANLNVHRDAYFDLVLDQSGECSYGYYDFSVPFPVDVNGGVVARWENDGSDYNGALRNGTHYAIMAHYEDLRANGQYSWKKFSGVMQPGQCYTITVNNTAPNYRFKKKAGTAIAASEILQLQKTEGTGTEADKGWNALGNGLLAMANLNMDNNTKVQLYDHETNSYTNHKAGELTFAIGSAFFIQATGNGSVSLVETNAPRALRAPVRRAAVENEEYRVRLTPAGASRFDDQMFLSAAEDASNSYEIGHDMKKMASASSAKIAQIWCSAYGLELSDVELPMTEGGTYFPLGVYSPRAGEYEISAMEGPADTELWLMYEDMPVWNLSNGSYTIELGKGTTNSYSLMLKQGGHYTPTDNEVVSGDNAQARKLIINDNLYIIRDGIRYDATGKRVD